VPGGKIAFTSNRNGYTPPRSYTSPTLQLFVMDDDVGPGLPMWLPRGAAMIEELEKLAKETEFAAGYVRVRTPHIARESLYLKSGHLPYYKESMFPPMELHEGAHGEAGEKDSAKYYLKAMNCPHHHKLFAAVPRSYRDLPLRFAEYGTCYRYEQSGELIGLMRVRSMQMNDAHIYMTPEQFEAEFNAVNEMYLKYFRIFGIEKYVMRFSTHAPEKLGKKYLDNPELWKETEDMVRNVLIESKIPYVEVADEAAFYGPKIDVQVWSAIGKEFSLMTNQVDFAQPARFDLKYTNKEGNEEIPLCIHRAPLSTHERLIGFLIEHYAGNFPVWLSPEQARVIPITDGQNEYSEKIAKQLRENGIRVHADLSAQRMNAKIRSAQLMKVPYMLVVGDNEMKAEQVSLRARDGSQQNNIPLAEFIARAKDRIARRAKEL